MGGGAYIYISLVWRAPGRRPVLGLRAGEFALLIALLGNGAGARCEWPVCGYNVAYLNVMGMSSVSQYFHSKAIFPAHLRSTLPLVLPPPAPALASARHDRREHPDTELAARARDG